MKSKVFYALLAGMAFLFCLGSVGALELGKISLLRGIIQTTVAMGCCLLLARRGQIW